MAKTDQESNAYSDAEAAQREQATLRRLLNTPPKPHDSGKESTEREARQRPKPSGDVS